MMELYYVSLENVLTSISFLNNLDVKTQRAVLQFSSAAGSAKTAAKNNM